MVLYSAAYLNYSFHQRGIKTRHLNMLKTAASIATSFVIGALFGAY